MKRTFVPQSRRLMQQLRGVTSLYMTEEMTQHDIPDMEMQSIPSEYRGMARVTSWKEGGDVAKNWLGTDRPFYVDVKRGETSLLTPSNDMVSVQDIMKVAHLEKVIPTPNN